MRNWIKLLENASFVPDLTQFVNDELIDSIIRENRWVDHGADLDDWLDGSCYATDHYQEIGITAEQAEHLESIPHAEAIRLPEFRKCVEHWVKFRIVDIQESLERGNNFDKIPPLTGDSVLTRVIRTDEPRLSSIGVYWTQHNPQSIVRVAPEHDTHPIIVLEVKAKDVTIDWYQTVRSRLDYSNGTDEEEIQLVRGSMISNIKVGRIDYRPDGRNDYFDLKKIVWDSKLVAGNA